MCMLGRHRTPEGAVYNQGLFFGACARCGEDLIRSGDRWTKLPKGLRVAWRNRGEQASAASFIALHPQSGLAVTALADAGGVVLRAVYWAFVDAIADRRTRKLLNRGIGVIRLPDQSCPA